MLDETRIARLEARLAEALPGAGAVAVEGLERIFGGASAQGA
jgi:hypothetical protein